MVAIHPNHDRITRPMRTHLKATSIGLGLVRLLLDAGRAAEAQETLLSLQTGLFARNQPECRNRRPSAAFREDLSRI